MTTRIKKKRGRPRKVAGPIVGQQTLFVDATASGPIEEATRVAVLALADLLRSAAASEDDAHEPEGGNEDEAHT